MFWGIVDFELKCLQITSLKFHFEILQFITFFFRDWSSWFFSGEAKLAKRHRFMQSLIVHIVRTEEEKGKGWNKAKVGFKQHKFSKNSKRVKLEWKKIRRINNVYGVFSITDKIIKYWVKTKENKFFLWYGTEGPAVAGCCWVSSINFAIINRYHDFYHVQSIRFSIYFIIVFQSWGKAEQKGKRGSFESEGQEKWEGNSRFHTVSTLFVSKDIFWYMW